MEEKSSSEMSNLSIGGNLNNSIWQESGDSPRNIKSSESMGNVSKEIYTPSNSARPDIQMQRNQLNSVQPPPIQQPQFRECTRHQCRHRRQETNASPFISRDELQNKINYNVGQNSEYANMNSKKDDVERKDRPNSVKFNPNVKIHQCPRIHENFSCPSSSMIEYNRIRNNIPYVCNKHAGHLNNKEYQFRRDVTNNFMQPRNEYDQKLCQQHLMQERDIVGNVNGREEDSEERNCQNNVRATEKDYRNEKIQNKIRYDQTVDDQQRNQESFKNVKFIDSSKCQNRQRSHERLPQVKVTKSSSAKCDRRKCEAPCKQEESTERHIGDKEMNEYKMSNGDNLKVGDDIVESGYPPIKTDAMVMSVNSSTENCNQTLMNISSGMRLKKDQEKLAVEGVKRRNGLE